MAKQHETLNIRGLKISVSRAIKAAAAAKGLTLGQYLETLMPHITKDLREAAREGRP